MTVTQVDSPDTIYMQFILIRKAEDDKTEVRNQYLEQLQQLSGLLAVEATSYPKLQNAKCGMDHF